MDLFKLGAIEGINLLESLVASAVRFDVSIWSCGA